MALSFDYNNYDWNNTSEENQHLVCSYFEFLNAAQLS